MHFRAHHGSMSPCRRHRHRRRAARRKAAMQASQLASSLRKLEIHTIAEIVRKPQQCYPSCTFALEVPCCHEALRRMMHMCCRLVPRLGGTLLLRFPEIAAPSPIDINSFGPTNVLGSLGVPTRLAMHTRRHPPPT